MEQDRARDVERHDPVVRRKELTSVVTSRIEADDVAGSVDPVLQDTGLTAELWSALRIFDAEPGIADRQQDRAMRDHNELVAGMARADTADGAAGLRVRGERSC